MSARSSYDDPAPIHQVITKPVTAVLGPTNTGKTYYALERMAAHDTGMIGLPLRLLAREVFDKMVARKSARQVALITGEEKIIPPNPSYFVCTVEAMPLEREVSFMAIDEVQLAADKERGRIFTERVLFARGRHETLLLGSDTMRPILKRLIPDIGFVSRERFSRLEYAGPKKVSRLPRRTAIVAFSSEAVYSIAELIRRQRGGAAVVMGALSPRTRNAQAALYQEGDVDYLVATDAIGMGLNMDIDHVAFAAQRKYDGQTARWLFPAEMAQIAGRAGRHVRDGTFGTTADCPPIDEEIAEAIENHEFDPVTALQWRSRNLEFSSLPALLRSLERKPPRTELVRARNDNDEDALRRLAAIEDIHNLARGGAALKLLWEVCQTPDFRKVSPNQHARMLAEIYRQLIDRGRIDENWVGPQLERLSRSDGDVDALSNRISHVRTWTYLTHRAGWLDKSSYWQEKARAIEDTLSDALHEKLTQRFVDRRTSVLLKKLKDDTPLLGGVTPEGEVIVEGEFVGRLIGFQFILDPRAKGPHAKAVRFAALSALKPELASRAAALATARDDEFSIRDGGTIWWRHSAIARLAKGPMPLRPEIKLVAMENLPAHALPRIEERLRDWFASKVEGILLPLVSLQKAINLAGDNTPEALTAPGRGLGFRLIENFGAVSRSQVFEEVKALDQPERGKLRKLGVRFGEYTIHLPALLKPAPAQLLTLLWALWSERDVDALEMPKAGLTSIPLNKDLPHAFYYACGYRPSGLRAVRIDMLERLAQEIRTAREGVDMREGFESTSKMMSLVGCSGEEFEGILKTLGLRKNTVKRMVPKNPPAETAIAAKEEEEEAKPATADVAPDSVPDSAPDSGSESVPASAPNSSSDSGSDLATTPNDAPSDARPAAQAPVESALDENVGGPSDSKEDSAAAPPVDTGSDTPANASLPPAEADNVEMEEVELTLWKSAPRQNNKPRRGPQAKGQSKETAPKDGKAFKGKRQAKQGKPRHDKPKGPRTFTSGPGKQNPEDSPFAALAALKGDTALKGDKG